MKKIALIIIISLLANTAFAAAEQVQLGYLSMTGCPSGALTPCFVPYSAASPMPIQLTITR